jgi:hypothetical protein
LVNQLWSVWRTAAAADGDRRENSGESHTRAAGRQERMSADIDEPSAKTTEQETAAEADRMEAKLDELGDHVAEARKKAEATSEKPGRDPDDPLTDVDGDRPGDARGDKDLGAVDEPPMA